MTTMPHCLHAGQSGPWTRRERLCICLRERRYRRPTRLGFKAVLVVIAHEALVIYLVSESDGSAQQVA